MHRHGPRSVPFPWLSPVYPTPLQVGKGWLALARWYTYVGEAERAAGLDGSGSFAKAAEALRRAWTVCAALPGPAAGAFEGSYHYLLKRVTPGGGPLEAGFRVPTPPLPGLAVGGDPGPKPSAALTAVGGAQAHELATSGPALLAAV